MHIPSEPILFNKLRYERVQLLFVSCFLTPKHWIFYLLFRNQPPQCYCLSFSNTVVGPYDDVMLPRGAKKVDWELELAFIVGKRGM